MKVKTKQRIAYWLYLPLALIMGANVILAAGWHGVLWMTIAGAGVFGFLHWIEPRKF